MHKYWGKKPYKNLHKIINEFSQEEDVLLDPFSGYGVFCCEAFIQKRNIISNDLNPISNLINEVLLSTEFEIEVLKEYWSKIKLEFEQFNQKLFQVEIDNSIIEARSILRDKDGKPLKVKYYINKKSVVKNLNRIEINRILKFDNSISLKDWFPDEKLITNSRISSKEGMYVKDLFTKRTLASHARLLSLINKKSKGIYKKALLIAFTSNLANCSKLLPPINSRSDMSPGAWMTGFYIGKTYIENNVLRYYENRLNKVIKGKIDYKLQIQNDLFSNEKKAWYKVTNDNAKKLKLDDNSVDYIFADPPYGGAVPYFEQSIIWNSWINKSVDYKNEIVISDSKLRDKNLTNFESDMNDVFKELGRVLKKDKFLTITYNSISGNEWKSITNSCITNGFTLHKLEHLIQKTFTPRQLNRVNTIQGDVIITLKNTKSINEVISFENGKLYKLTTKKLKEIIGSQKLTLSQIYNEFFKFVFNNSIIINDLDLIKLLKNEFKFNGKEYYL